MSVSRHVFVSGGTGYVGSRLIPRLLERGHRVRALVRPGSESKVPAGAEAVPGDALRSETFSARVPPCDTFVQLVGVSHPSPAKAPLFRSIDLASARAGGEAAAAARVSHFVYVSVAQPAPAMKAYVAARAEGEAFLTSLGVDATFLRPWYVLGPGHRWPYALLPAYWLLEKLPPTREGARRLGLVTLAQMVAALVHAVENPARAIRIVDVPGIRAAENA
ncbi:MAG TPA: NAD(P)H-binding protein [Thermoanaerobaculia bacterium]|nr:NAD(P)H-binding protein [Thermoanaerobaculia bacterium]